MSTPAITGSDAPKTSFTTSVKLELDLTNPIDINEIKRKFTDVTDQWGKDNADIQARAKMWQYGKVTVKIPTGSDGKEIPGWANMSDTQKEAIWVQAIKGEGGYKISEVKFEKSGGNLACDYMYRYEGMGKRNEGTDDSGKSANATMLNNIMTRNSNYFSQESQKFNYEMSNLQTSIQILQQVANAIFDVGKNSIS